MGAPKNVQTNEYGFFQKPSWQGLEDLKGWRPEADPTIGANFARQRQDFERSFVTPTGGYSTPQLRQQEMRAGIQDIGQNEAVARRADQYDQNRLRLGQLSDVSSQSAPEFAQTKGQQQQQGGFWRSLAGGALGMASKFI